VNRPSTERYVPARSRFSASGAGSGFDLDFDVDFGTARA
jgi:hypothetical protein